LLTISAFVNEGQEGNLAGALHGSGQFALVFRAGTSLTPWTNFALFGHITAQHITMLVIDFQVLIRAEGADLWARKITSIARPAAFFSTVSVVHEYLLHCGLAGPRKI
jgi:hypothetical protein